MRAKARGKHVSEQDPYRAARLVLALRQRGVTNIRVLNVVETTPREPFVPEGYADMSYDDLTLPIECGQELSKPTEVGRMLQALDVREGDTVLEIGTGTGYTAAILSKLARRVYTIDRFRALTVSARDMIEKADLRNVEVRRADGLLGWPEAAPFDRILLSGAVTVVPQILLDQLAPGGVLVSPVEHEAGQQITRYSFNENNEIISRPFGASKVLPLIPGLAKEL